MSTCIFNSRVSHKMSYSVRNKGMTNSTSTFDIIKHAVDREFFVSL